MWRKRWGKELADITYVERGGLKREVKQCMRRGRKETKNPTNSRNVERRGTKMKNDANDVERETKIKNKTTDVERRRGGEELKRIPPAPMWRGVGLKLLILCAMWRAKGLKSKITSRMGREEDLKIISIVEHVERGRERLKLLMLCAM